MAEPFADRTYRDPGVEEPRGDVVAKIVQPDASETEVVSQSYESARCTGVRAPRLGAQHVASEHEGVSSQHDRTLGGTLCGELAKLKEALKGEDASATNAASESLQSAWHEAAAKLYQSASPPPSGAGAAASPGPEPAKKSGAVDADFEVMN